MGQSHIMVVISITCFLIEHSFPLLVGLVLQPRDLRKQRPFYSKQCSFYDYAKQRASTAGIRFLHDFPWGILGLKSNTI